MLYIDSISVGKQVTIQLVVKKSIPTSKQVKKCSLLNAAKHTALFIQSHTKLSKILIVGLRVA